jgi:hypothetical protein
MLPYMNKFLFLADSYKASLLLRARVNAMLTRLGLLLYPKKGVWTPTHVDDHLGPTIDLHKGEFQAPNAKVCALAKQATSIIGREATDARWLPARHLAAIEDKAHFLYLAIGTRRRGSGGGPGGGCARRPIGIPSPPRGGRWKPRSRARHGTVGG